jgi:hypothetical protein
MKYFNMKITNCEFLKSNGSLGIVKEKYLHVNYNVKVFHDKIYI